VRATVQACLSNGKTVANRTPDYPRLPISHPNLEPCTAWSAQVPQAQNMSSRSPPHALVKATQQATGTTILSFPCLGFLQEFLSCMVMHGLFRGCIEPRCCTHASNQTCQNLTRTGYTYLTQTGQPDSPQVQLNHFLFLGSKNISCLQGLEDDLPSRKPVDKF